MRKRLSIAVLVSLAIFGSIISSSCDRRHGADDPLPATRIAAQPASDPVSQVGPKPRSFQMIAVGDIMLDRDVWRFIQSSGVHSILAKVRSELLQADVRFGNLECPLSSVGPHDARANSFRADPSAVQVLLDGKFDIVSVANNHFLNAGREGALHSFDTLQSKGILWAGGQRDRTKGSDPVFLTVRGLKVGFLAYTDLSFEHGSYSKVDPKREQFVAQVEAARAQCDVLFVSFHWGEEYKQLPNVRQRKLGHLAIDSGADCVLGHHPHVLEGIESYHGRPILYSMGNFIFDQREGERMESAIFHLTYTEGGKWDISATPVWIPWSRLGPIYPEQSRADKIAGRLVRISQALSTTLSTDAGKAHVTIDAAAAAQTASDPQKATQN